MKRFDKLKCNLKFVFLSKHPNSFVVYRISFFFSIGFAFFHIFLLFLLCYMYSFACFSSIVMIVMPQAFIMHISFISQANDWRGNIFIVLFYFFSGFLHVILNSQYSKTIFMQFAFENVLLIASIFGELTSKPIKSYDKLIKWEEIYLINTKNQIIYQSKISSSFLRIDISSKRFQIINRKIFHLNYDVTIFLVLFFCGSFDSIKVCNYYYYSSP